MTYEATHSATSLQASEGGVTHFDLQGGPMTDLFGQEVVLASPSVPQASSVAQTMSATYGLRSSASSASVALQQSLASRKCWARVARPCLRRPGRRRLRRCGGKYRRT